MLESQTDSGAYTAAHISAVCEYSQRLYTDIFRNSRWTYSHQLLSNQSEEEFFFFFFLLQKGTSSDDQEVFIHLQSDHFGQVKNNKTKPAVHKNTITNTKLRNHSKLHIHTVKIIKKTQIFPVLYCLYFGLETENASQCLYMWLYNAFFLEIK